MDEMIKNTATGITLLTVLCLPLVTVWQAYSSPEMAKKIQVQQTNSVLEFPLVNEGYSQDQNIKIESLNKELNGLITVFSVPNALGN